VIVTYNSAEYIETCLRAIIEAPTEVPLRVIVVDNASTDSTRELVERFATVQLICNSRNLGFGRAVNQAIRQARRSERPPAFWLLLNPDTQLLPGALDALYRFAEEEADIGICGPRMESLSGVLHYSCRSFPNWFAGLFRNTWLGKLFPNAEALRRYLMADLNHNRIADVDWVSGAAMMIRRSCLDEIGILDERFFMYCEDVDLCWRAKRAGWKVAYFPGAVVRHRIAASSDQRQLRSLWNFHTSHLKFFTKTNGVKGRLLWPFAALLLYSRAFIITTKYIARYIKGSLFRGKPSTHNPAPRRAETRRG
jgi:hypothetical protein